MPGWHAATKEARANDELVIIGVIQEQHADRCRLFAQWQQFDWPILQDQDNQLGLRAVPISVAIDEDGVVVSKRLKVNQLKGFLTRPRGKETPPENTKPEPTTTLSVEQHEDLLKTDPERAELHFSYGVALRRRFDSKDRQPNDFQAAVDAWTKALELDPNQYIYRRRIQQYGPRLIKPYPFYDWVDKARTEILARGETPIELSVEPSGAEIAKPSRKFNSATAINPDPDTKITLDNTWIKSKSVVVPGKIKRGEALRVHVRLKPTDQAKWNNEAEPSLVWIDLPEGWQSTQQLATFTPPQTAESKEERRFEFELKSPRKAGQSQKISGYALYYVCDSENGQCLFRRQNLEFTVQFK